LPETVAAGSSSIGRSTADLDRAEFVRLGVEYVAHVGREA